MKMWNRFLFLKSIGVFQSGVPLRHQLSGAYYILFGENAPEVQRLRADTALLMTMALKETGVFVIHEPEAGCPEGWIYAENLFSESDGSRQPGCILVKGNFGNPYGVRVDYLLPGESVKLPIFVPHEFENEN